MLATALPDSALPAVNQISLGAIPDVSDLADSRTIDIYRLYSAGVLTGDTGGAFHPGDTISRAEAAVIAARMADPGQRKRFSLAVPEPDRDGTIEQLYRLAEKALAIQEDIALLLVTPELYRGGSGQMMQLPLKLMVQWAARAKWLVAQMAESCSDDPAFSALEIPLDDLLTSYENLLGISFDAEYPDYNLLTAQLCDPIDAQWTIVINTMANIKNA